MNELYALQTLNTLCTIFQLVYGILSGYMTGGVGTIIQEIFVGHEQKYRMLYDLLFKSRWTRCLNCRVRGISRLGE